MRLRLVRFLCTGVLVVASMSGYGQNAAIDQVRNQLTVPGGCTVQIAGLWATTTITEQPSELRIMDGKVARGSARVIHGKTNVPIQPGQTLRVMGVAGSSDAKNDLLRVTVQAAGLAVPVVFVLPKGSLASTQAPQLMSLVATVLQPSGNTAAGNSGTYQPKKAANAWNPTSITWRDAYAPPVPGVTLTGTATSGARRGMVDLQVLCFSKNSTELWLSVPFQLMDFSSSDLVNATGNLGILKVGDNAEASVHLGGTSGQQSPARLYVSPFPEQLYTANFVGKPLNFSVLPPNGKGTPIEAKFALPSDASPLMAITVACKAEKERQDAEAAAEAAKAKANIVLSCPDKPGKTLADVKVKAMPSGKPMTFDPTDGTESDWDLKTLKKGEHAVLECIYTAPKSSKAAPGNHITLPIPVSAISCRSSSDEQGHMIEATCSKE